MKAVRFHEHGGTDRLVVEEIPTPVPGPGEALVRVRAAALNGFDPMMLEGSTNLKTPLPLTPCGDVAGEIAALGPSVGDWKIGDRVSVYPILPVTGMMGETAQGGLGEFVSLPVGNLLRIPDGVTFVQAAALPVAYGTAWRMVSARGRIQPGETVLILGATGGVGVGALQFAKMKGARVIACGGGEEKCEKLRALGADEVIDTARESVRAAVYARCGKPPYAGDGPGGVDVAINYIGGDTMADTVKVVRRFGRILVCGATAGYESMVDLRYLWSYEQSIVGSNGWTPDDQAALLDMVDEGVFAPVIHAVRPMAEVRDAYDELIGRRVFGKSVLTP